VFFKRFFSKFEVQKKVLKIFELHSYQEFQKFFRKNLQGIAQLSKYEASLIPKKQKSFYLDGFCYPCQKKSQFLVDFKYAIKQANKLIPNWRERLVCKTCKLNNRMRATLHIFLEYLSPQKGDVIYITEQTTPVYLWLKERFENLYASEFLGESIPYGTYNGQGIRNENLTALSFPEEKFAYILSFDVLEHIPNYKKALKECFRCLKTGGYLYFSVPFLLDSPKNIQRAFLDEEGYVHHILPPEYHGDPLNPEGCLCFYHFGWELLEDLKNIGFKKAKVLLYWSRDFGYLGGYQPLFITQK